MRHSSPLLGFMVLGLTLGACSADGTSVDASVATKTDARSAKPNPQPSDVLTQHNDAARTGVNSSETCLTPSNVTQLVSRATFHVDGQVYGQPLVVTVGTKRLVVVATTTNVLAAFDLASSGGSPVWSLDAGTFGVAGKVERNVIGPLGILSTPVIDPATNRLYLVARSCASATTITNCPWTVHAVDVGTGAHLDSAVVKASFKTEDGGSVDFDPDTEWNRPGLLLQSGKVVAAWGVGQNAQQHEEELTYHGFITAFDASNLQAAPIVYVTTPHTRGGGIWQGGGGIVGDGTGVYFNSGNGLLNPNAKKPTDFPTSPRDQENSLVQLKFSGNAAQVANYFDARPYHPDGTVFQYTNLYDYDMASAGPAYIPGTDDLVTGTKGGLVYLVDRTTMKQRQEPLSPFSVLHLPKGQTLHIASDDDGPECVNSPVVWRRTTDGDDDAMVYFWPRHDRLSAFHYDHATTSMKLVANSDDIAAEGGGMISFSIDGATKDSALLWAVVSSNNAGAPAELRAYSPTSLKRLFTANIPSYAKFGVPTISAGRVIAVSWPASGGSDVLEYGVPGCGG